MDKNKVKKIIQVPMEDELLERIDATAGVVAESRAAFIREACKQRLRSFAAKELDRRYMDGYLKKPEGLDWAETSARLLAKRLPKEKW
jgi:metal-responsive CopG/Arc/MetJ family transcriptional regulator